MTPTRRHFLAGLIAATLASPATATGGTDVSAAERWQADPATIFNGSDVTLEEFRWIARPVVVFADTPANPAFRRQVELLEADIEALVERDVVIIVDTDPAARSSVRQKLRPRGFMLVLMAKDGTVMLRKPFPWNVREISRSIDKLPLRQQEIRERNATAD